MQIPRHLFLQPRALPPSAPHAPHQWSMFWARQDNLRSHSRLDASPGLTAKAEAKRARRRAAWVRHLESTAAGRSR